MKIKPGQPGFFMWKNPIYECAYCNAVIKVGAQAPPEKRTIDHIIPRAHGGTNHQDNRADCCEPCNTMKGDLALEKFLLKILRDYRISNNRKSKMAYNIRRLIVYRDANMETMYRPRVSTIR